jgi:hypothetical protein
VGGGPASIIVLPGELSSAARRSQLRHKTLIDQSLVAPPEREPT